MSFHEQVQNDIDNTFFNTDHYAVSGYYYFEDINYDTTGTPIETDFVFYPTNISIEYGETRKASIGDYKLFVKETTTDSTGGISTIVPNEGDYVSISNKFYTITNILDDALGVYECMAISYDQKAGINTQNIRPFRSI